MKHFKLLFIAINILGLVYGQISDPVITKWKQTTGTGYNGIQNNVLKVQYSSNYVYVNANSIPSYSIGPWSQNPNTPKAQNFVFKFPRQPQSAATKVATPLGHIGIFLDGVSIYNPHDGMYYNNAGVWKRNAYFWEGVSFDSCNGHADRNGEYHLHLNPKCLYTASSSSHSPLLGYAFDGYPIYGPYGYSTPMSSTSSIKKLSPSYRLRSITKRDKLANGTLLQTSQYGPDVSTTYPLGSFNDDYEYVNGLGDLDKYNGRICVTPEYPGGTYAYFIATDSNLNAAYPYVIGESFYGSPLRENMGPTGGKITITEPVTTYF